MSLSLNPPKGTQDRLPEEMRVRQYIFDTWKSVCEQFGYEQYLGPLVENKAIWEAKSGEDVGGSELTLITNRDGEISDLALRPEMTPTVSRMITKHRRELPKPIRWFSIANFYRNERPQRGRNREFRQLNADMFGETSLQAEVEILQLAIEIMLQLGAPKDSFVVSINHRKLIEYLVSALVGNDSKKKVGLIRLMDKRHKIGIDKFVEALDEYNLSTQNRERLLLFMQTKSNNLTVPRIFLELFSDDVAQEYIGEINTIFHQLTDLGYEKYIKFDGTLMRGFDYYDGLVFEVFDLHPDNNRALFGGGRYNGLAEIFGAKEPIPAIGFAPGDETLRLFLESRGLVDQIHAQHPSVTYIPLLDESCLPAIHQVAKNMRAAGVCVELGLSVKKLGKALDYANKKGMSKVVILGPEELEKGEYVVKDLDSGEEDVQSP